MGSRVRRLPVRCRPLSAAAEMRQALREMPGDQAERAAVLGCGVRTLRRYRKGEGLRSLQVYLRAREAGKKQNPSYQRCDEQARPSEVERVSVLGRSVAEERENVPALQKTGTDD